MKCESYYGSLLSKFRNELDEANQEKIPTEVSSAKAKVALMEMLIRDDQHEINDEAFPDQDSDNKTTDNMDFDPFANTSNEVTVIGGVTGSGESILRNSTANDKE